MRSWRGPLRRATAAALLALAMPAAAQKVAEWPFSVDQFGGINNYLDSARIGPNDATEAVDVLTEHGYVEKRPGSFAVTSFPYAPENVAEYVNLSGTRFIVAHASASIYATSLVSLPTAIATVTANSNVDFVTAYGKSIAVDGTYEIEYDGVSTGTAQGGSSGFPGCQYVEFYLNRVWCSNIISESTSRVRVSSVGATAYWTVPANPKDVPDGPNFFDISRDDGQANTCFKRTPWGMVVGKRRSMWIVKGTDNTNWYVRNIDPAIGCVDDRYMQMVEGRLKWLAVDGIYSWDGASPVALESQDIDATIKDLRQSQGQVANWTVDSRSDWSAGLANDNTRSWNLTDTPGSIFPTSMTFVDSGATNFNAGGSDVNTTTSAAVEQLRASTGVVIGGDFATPASWICKSSGTFGATGCKNSVADGAALNGSSLVAVCPTGDATCSYSCDQFATCGVNLYYVYVSTALTGGIITSQSFNISNLTPALSIASITQSTRNFVGFGCPSDPAGKTVRDCTIYESSFTANGFTLQWDIYGACVGINCDGTGSATQRALVGISNVRITSYPASGVRTSATFDTIFSTPTIGPLSVTMSSMSSVTVSFQEQDSADGSSWSTAASIAPGARAVGKRRYWRHLDTFTTYSGTVTATVSTFTVVAIETGTYSSAVHFIGTAITSFKGYNATETNDGAIRYYVRASTNLFTQLSSTPAYTIQTNNTTPTISTGTYYQFEVDSTLMTSSSQTERVDRVLTQWQEGTGIPGASAFFNHRYYLSVAIASTTQVNDTLLVRQRTGKWVFWKPPAVGGLTIFNNLLYSSSANSDGKVWQMLVDGLYNDDGASIDSYWTTPDYIFNDAVSQKVVSEFWVDAQPSSTTILNISYAVDKSTTYATKPLDLGSSLSSINRRVPIEKGFALGKYLRLQFRNAQNAYFRMNGFTLFGQTKPREQ